MFTICYRESVDTFAAKQLQAVSGSTSHVETAASHSSCTTNVWDTVLAVKQSKMSFPVPEEHFHRKAFHGNPSKFERSRY